MKEIREKLGLSLEALAQYLGVESSHLAQLENGKAPMPGGLQEKLKPFIELVHQLGNNPAFMKRMSEVVMSFIAYAQSLRESVKEHETEIVEILGQISRFQHDHPDFFAYFELRNNYFAEDREVVLELAWKDVPEKDRHLYMDLYWLKYDLRMSLNLMEIARQEITAMENSRNLDAFFNTLLHLSTKNN